MSSLVSMNEIPLNKVKPYIIANVKLQCKKAVTARACILGSPGCGKSDLLRQICEENGWGLVIKYLSNMSLEQITGIPCRVEDGDHARFTKPEIFNFDNLDFKPDGYEVGSTPTVLLIDDFHLADKIIQKYLFQLLTYKSINSYSLPENCAVILAGNKMTDKALAHTVPAPVMNRISVYEVKADPKDWLMNYAFKKGVRSDITTFINSKGDAYFVQTPVESMPWASPRSWTFLSEQMDEYEELYKELPINSLRLIANSLIGEEFASEFIAYREIFSKWNIDKLIGKSDKDLLNMFTTEANKNPVTVYAVINAIMTWMIDKTKKFGFDVKDENVKKIVCFAYNILMLVLQLKVKGIQIRPLVVAGTNYLYMYYNVIQSSQQAAKFDAVISLFLNQMKQQRDIDWLYYEICATIFNYPLSDSDKKAIDAAKANLKL